MPTYEYHCDHCEHHFDEFQSITADALKKCPECKKPKLRRIFGTGAAILFKGSGFYQTDYRSESYKAGAKAEEASNKAATTDKTATTAANGEASPGKTAKSEGKSSKSTKSTSDD